MVVAEVEVEVEVGGGLVVGCDLLNGGGGE